MILHVWDIVRVKDYKGQWHTGIVSNIHALVPSKHNPGGGSLPQNVLEADLDSVLVFQVSSPQLPDGIDITPNKLDYSARDGDDPDEPIPFAYYGVKIVGPDADPKFKLTNFRLGVSGNGEPQVVKEST